MTDEDKIREKARKLFNEVGILSHNPYDIGTKEFDIFEDECGLQFEKFLDDMFSTPLQE